MLVSRGGWSTFCLVLGLLKISYIRLSASANSLMTVFKRLIAMRQMYESKASQCYISESDSETSLESNTSRAAVKEHIFYHPAPEGSF